MMGGNDDCRSPYWKWGSMGKSLLALDAFIGHKRIWSNTEMKYLSSFPLLWIKEEEGNGTRDDGL